MEGSGRRQAGENKDQNLLTSAPHLDSGGEAEDNGPWWGAPRGLSSPLERPKGPRPTAGRKFSLQRTQKNHP